MKITVAPSFEDLRDEILSLPERIAKGEGSLLYNGRNKVWLFDHDDKKYVVKRFHDLGILKGIIYTFFRKNKARRAYDNGLLLLKEGVKNPAPIALLEEKRHGLYKTLYYICAYTDWQAIRKPLTEDVPFNRQMTIEYAQFVASLHEKGIIHRDLNNTNVLYNLSGEHYEFMLIDINRMSFTEDGIAAPLKDCLENLTLFANRGDMFDLFAAEYVKARGWDAARVTEIFEAKATHDRHWQRKKRIKRLFSHHHKNK